MLLEGLLRKQEKESNYVELESWIWGSLTKYMESAKEVTLLDTPGVKVQAEVDMMALASRLEGMVQKSGTISSLREVLTWKLTFAIQTKENKRQQEERVARFEADRRAWELLPRAMENLQLGPRGIVLVPAEKRKRCPNPNNSRREIESEAEYYDSEGNPVEDNLVEMVSATKDTRGAP